MGMDHAACERVDAVEAVLSAPCIDFDQLKKTLIHLLEYISSPVGRTDENCSAVDCFFGVDSCWTKKSLPEPFCEVLDDIGGTLHDTVSAPEIAYNFWSTPEQLLERVRALNVE